MDMDLIHINQLKTYFFQGKGLLSKLFGKGIRVIHAVDDVSLRIRRRHTFGLVGESGCGKTTLGQTIFGLVKPLEGEIFFNGDDILKACPETLHRFRQKAQMVFQDQHGCLNPRMTAGQAIAEPIERFQREKHATDIQQRVCELLEAVQLPWEAALKFPNELSGGQARRIGVARAIALNPEFILADEPTSGLDISTAATILNLMQDLQEQMDITYLWISHNLNQVRYMAEDMAVMYLGKIVETGRTEDVFQRRAHPYTQALISAVPKVGGAHGPAKIILEGEIPSPINPPSGCRFRTRCRYMTDKCRRQEPVLTEIGPGHFAACHLLSSDR
jgi:oligopeptide transport system ATP-binding protein